MAISELFDLRGKTAIVTGGSTGLGEQMAAGLAEAGADLVITARKLERLEAASERLSKIGPRVIPVQCDVANESDVEQLINTTIQHFGKIDILVNNAGTTWGALAEDYPLDKWERVIRTNVTGVFLCSKAVGRVMIGNREGKIINIASVEGFVGGDPDHMNAIAYNTSKGAVVNFTRDLAVKWAKYNINVNGIAPGWFPSNMTSGLMNQHEADMLKAVPLGRFGGKSDLKGAAIFLASAASDYVTGHVLCVDGGALAW